MLLKLNEELENKIVKLAKSIKEIGLDNVEFEYMRGQDFFRVFITEYRNNFEIVHRDNNCELSKADIFILNFNEDKLRYEYSEED